MKTDNKYLIDKIALRVGRLPAGDHLRVLNAFGGENIIWAAIKRIEKNRRIDVLCMDRREMEFAYLRGDNMKFMAGMDLSKFDVIDLDAYGCPLDQLEMVFRRGYRGVVFVTFIQTMNGALPYGMLERLGYTKAMIEKCPSLFNRHGLEKMVGFLNLNGVRRIYARSRNRHNYLCFTI